MRPARFDRATSASAGRSASYPCASDNPAHGYAEAFSDVQAWSRQWKTREARRRVVAALTRCHKRGTIDLPADSGNREERGEA